MPVGGATDETGAGLPAAMTESLAAYERHLRAERGMSEHSVRAYRGDVTTLLEHASRMGRSDVAGLDLPVLRSWLAGQAARGKARTTMARRAAAARGFTAWATRERLLADDPGALLATPRTGRTLPGVLRQDEAGALLDLAAYRVDHLDPEPDEEAAREPPGTPRATPAPPRGAARRWSSPWSSGPCASGTSRCWRSSTPAGSGSASCADWTCTTSTRGGG